MSYPDFLIDKRVLSRNLANGLVDRKEYEKLLKKLPDVADNAEACLPDEPEPEAGETPEATEE